MFGPSNSQPGPQTVRLRKGKHASPARGACVVELASMLAGDRFTDHPRSVCPAIASFLRGYNDSIPSGQEDELYPYAPLVVGTRATRRVAAQRARRILEWAGEDVAAGRLLQWSSPWPSDWDTALRPAVAFALGMPPARRRVAVAALLEQLVAIGRPPEPTASPEPCSAPERDTSRTDAPHAASVR